jgi:hypothetical protein
MVFFAMGLIFVGSGLIFRFGFAHAATLPFDCAQGMLRHAQHDRLWQKQPPFL